MKEWRQKRKSFSCPSDKMIQDEIRSSKSMKTYILLIPEGKTGEIQERDHFAEACRQYICGVWVMIQYEMG